LKKITSDKVAPCPYRLKQDVCFAILQINGYTIFIRGSILLTSILGIARAYAIYKEKMFRHSHRIYDYSAERRENSGIGKGRRHVSICSNA
jgi:hypothetical protein